MTFESFAYMNHSLRRSRHVPRTRMPAPATAALPASGSRRRATVGLGLGILGLLGCGAVLSDAAAADARLAPAQPAAPAAPRVPAEAAAVAAFWRDAGSTMWFAKDDAFDRRFRERFVTLYEQAARQELAHWLDTPQGALALLILLDQFPRNAFRGTPGMYATDALARRMADAAIAAGHDRAVEPALQIFFYLPFGHSEDPADQERSVMLAQRLGQPSIGFAERHRDIVRRFGRFPHRNPILGRRMTAEEQRFLDEGGFAG